MATMWDASVPVFIQWLTGLKDVVQEAAEYHNTNRLESDALLTLAGEVWQATEHALGAGRAAGVPVPNLPVTDDSFEVMHSQIDETINFLQDLTPEQLYGREEEQVTVIVGDQPHTLPVQTYLYHWAIPNFYFHSTIAHNLFRPLPGQTPFTPDPSNPPPRPPRRGSVVETPQPAGRFDQIPVPLRRW